MPMLGNRLYLKKGTAKQTMSMDLSSIKSSLSTLSNLYNTSDKTENESKDVNEQIRTQAKELINNRKTLVNYLDSKDKVSFTSNLLKNDSKTEDAQNTSLLRAMKSMKSTTGMSPIEKYKYMMEQAQNMETVDTTEPDAEKLLSKSEKIIQQAMTQGITTADTVRLTQALTAKQIALSRLDMVA